MRIRSYLYIIAALVFFPVQNSRSQPANVSVLLQNLYDRILFTSIDKEKIRLNDSIILLIDSYVSSDSVFSHRFPYLRYLGQVTSPDSKLKIINWNVFLRDGNNRYFCYFIKKGEKRTGNKVYKLTGNHNDKPIATNVSYSEKNWYGALYYSIQPFRKDYIILGIDQGSSFITRKIIDVLSFTEDGGLLFGKSCFVRGKETRSREVLEYTSEGVISLRFSSPKLIIFDHLDVYSTGHENNPDSYGAGLSFDGYRLNKGSWEFVSNIDAKNIRKK